MESENTDTSETINDRPLDHSPSSEDEAAREEQRFKDGQILRMVRVRFPGNAKSFPFLVGKRQIEYGQKVVAMSDRGVAVGYVNSFPYDIPFDKAMLPIRSISKLATDEDIKKEEEVYRHEKRSETLCQKLIEKHHLDMQLTHVEFTQFGKKAVFYFIAPARVDFRELVKEMVSELKMRVELRQISVRDRSASVGGIGPCGRELCCSSFLSKYGNTSVKMAKNQDLSINYSKLNGVCGQLKCCLSYEDEVYAEKRKKLPREGDYILCHNGDKGEVIRLNLLSEYFDMITVQGVKKRYVREQFKHTLETLDRPDYYDTISDDTKVIVGFDEMLKSVAKKKEKDFSEAEVKGKDYAQQIFVDLFGAATLDASMPELKEPESTTSRKLPNFDEELPEINYLQGDEDDDEEDEDFEEEMTQAAPPRPVHNTRPPQHTNQNNQNHQQGQRNQQQGQPPRPSNNSNNNNQRRRR